MKASAVINSYKNGKRDFSGQKLRGRNFAGQDLSDANFSHCDIRGANFTGANLTKANFTGATAGLQKRWMMGLLLVLLLFIGLSSLLSSLVGVFVTYIFDSSSVENQVMGWTSLLILLILCLVSYFRGLGGELVAFTIALVVFLAVFVALSITRAKLIAVVAASLAAVFVSGAATLVGSVAIAIAVAVSVTILGIKAGAGAIALSLVMAIVVGIEDIVGILYGIGILSGTILLTLFASYIGYRVMKGDPRDAWIKNFAVAFAATGGTTFKNADLTDANFTKATLKSTDFRDAILSRTCFKNTQKLDRIRPGKTLLRQPRVRELLITGDGYKKNYKDADLRGANLDGANLNQANLKQCDLSEASLRATNLEWANLTEVSALQTNFTRCNLTGACLEAWNIDKTTILDNVDCQYIFLLEEPDQNGNRERRPHDPDKVFQPGDFQQLYSKIMNTVQLLLRNGVNSEAFKIAFQKIMEENPEITYNSIQGIEKKGKDVVVTVEVPQDADKGNIEHQFNEAYELRLEAVKQTALLEAEKEHKKELKEINQNLTEIAKLALINQPNSTTIIDNKPMTNSPDNSQNITAGRDVTLKNSNANLREISDNINTLIQQLPEQKDGENISIKELLSQLKILIETNENLDDENKQDALEEVENLAKAANKPEDSNLKKLARRSKNALIGIISNLPNATKLVQECNKLLPAIAELLGLS